MKTYIVTKVRHSDRDVRGLEDLFQLYLIKIIESKYDADAGYKSSNVIEISHTRHMDFDATAWNCIKPEVEALMSEFTKAMLYSEADIEVGVDFIYWDEENNRGEMIKYRMDCDDGLNVNRMGVTATDSLMAKIKAVQYILDSELVHDSYIKDEFAEILNLLIAELEPKKNQPSDTDAPTEVSDKIDEHVCRTMNDVIEKMNKLIATVEKLEEKMLTK